MRLLPDKRIYVTAITTVLALAGCASATGTVDGKTRGPDSGLAAIQLPKSYPCQNLHVRPADCPPR